MCRILCIASKKGINKERASNSLQLLNRGGPDGFGEYFEDNLYIGHRRLAIIDLSNKSAQPFFFKHIVISYNGEIYNYKTCRDELKKQFNAEFKTDGDTEVIAQAYYYLGIDFLKKLDGFFAIIIYDKNKQTIFAARDFFGVKPLYYGIIDDNFFISSELKAIKNYATNIRLDNNAIGCYFEKGYIDAPHSIYKEVFKLNKGNYIQFNIENFEIKQTPFSTLDFTAQFKYNNYGEFKEFIHAKLKENFKKRLIADVPISVLLSGGLDSSLVTAFYAKENVNFTTFTIGFEDTKYDESNYAKKIANYLGVTNNSFICNEQDFIHKLKILPTAFDEPFGDSSAIPTLLVAEYIHKNGYKVALSSDGGDEIFGGYSRYLFALKLKKYAPLLNKSIIYLIHQILEKVNPQNNAILHIKNPNGKSRILHEISKNLQDIDLYKYLLHATKQIDLNNIFINPIVYNEYNFKNELSYIANMCKTDVDSYLSEDILTKIDRSMMYYGIEGREPFLDKQVLEIMLQAPDAFKIHKNKGKVILRDILSAYIPTELYDRPKMGFGIPMQKWVNGLLHEEIMEIFNNTHFLSAINIDKNKLLKNKYLNQNINFKWYVYNLYKWYNTYN